MNLAVMYGMKTLLTGMADTPPPDDTLSRNPPGMELKQRVSDFEAQMKSAYNSLSPEEQEKVDAKIEQVKEFVQDKIKREVKEQAQDATVDPASYIAHCLQSSEITLQTSRIS